MTTTDTLKSLQIAEEIIQEFIKNEKMFTSVDIANTVKIKGYWIRNSEIAKYLRDNINNISEFINGDYIVSQITVVVDNTTGKTAIANLYHPINKNPYDYKDTNQRALSPDEITSLSTNNQPPTPPTGRITGSGDKKPGFSLLNWFK